MFGTIRKHQTWLWAVIITITIISFVVFFSPTSKLNSSGRGSMNYGSINGARISPEEFQEAARELQVRYYFVNAMRWMDQDAMKDLERDTYYRLMLIHKQDEM